MSQKPKLYFSFITAFIVPILFFSGRYDSEYRLVT